MKLDGEKLLEALEGRSERLSGFIDEASYVSTLCIERLKTRVIELDRLALLIKAGNYTIEETK